MAFLGKGELRRLGLGDVVVDARGAAFLSTLPTELSVLDRMATDIGPAPYFMTSSYGEKWTPWYARWRDLYDRGIATLPDNSEARTTFIAEMNKLNKTANSVKNGSTAIQLLHALLTGNPLAVIRYTIGNDPGAVAKDLVNAGKDVYAPQLGWFEWVWEHKWWIVGGLAVISVGPQAIGLALALRRKK